MTIRECFESLCQVAKLGYCEDRVFGRGMHTFSANQTDMRVFRPPKRLVCIAGGIV